ncbi:esterase/lipase family protein [Hydrocarboniphaga sp.]|uniref:esterase/lipase family protein n=1 Tax=Hydrocarboniphaga sp. TaxID=2033016 RepID=UPI003D0DA3B9
MIKKMAGRLAGVMLLLCVSAQPAFALFDYTKTQYPIVLTHGLFGWDSIHGFDYFFLVPQALQISGAKVYVTQVSATNGVAERGEQLLRQVEDIVALSGSGKVNLVGHSQGGMDARYVAAVRPDLVASVTTVGSPHKGSAVADLLLTLAPADTVPGSISNLVGSAAGTLIDLLSEGGKPQSFLNALGSLSTSGAAAINQQYPAGIPTSDCGSGATSGPNGMRFYSWGGVGQLTTVIDPSDAALLALGLAFGFEANDGLVGRCSNHFGQVLRDDYLQNHLDEINQLAGLVSPLSNPLPLYRIQANRLKQAGL